MYCPLKNIFILSFILLFSFNTFAVETHKNDRLTCFAKHLDTNKEVPVKTISAITSKKIATAQWPLGYPTIAIDYRAFLKLPINTRQFIYYHECAHLKFKLDDEFIADCISLNLTDEKHELSEIDIRKLVKTLVEKFGMSRRWSELLHCDLMQKAKPTTQ
ncbi:MAG TPA: hypothetical protein EYQ42_06425 [Thiotrichaceae bacterium]|jgi:capsid portal protein|nr:hypothetical protein [Thiotrichaceae bacterium]HIM08091.1 hypothetical protein [Gammaproteobacteria bacterium]